MEPAGIRPDKSKVVYSSLRDEPDFAELLPFFVDELPEKQTVLSQLAQSNDFESLRREAHKLRGSAGGYGFQGLSDLAGKLEESCKNSVRDEAAILQSVDELLDYLGRVRA
ncbi:MAG: Hpt domain-containing protein [Planctomycetes bacterium]|nr:Hpt domain-containing protein [Planctomycetota bacterium]